jgi:hypothetical protein
MDYYYAQLKEIKGNLICVGLSQLTGPVEQQNMIPLTEEEFLARSHGERYNPEDGSWDTIEDPFGEGVS